MMRRSRLTTSLASEIGSHAECGDTVPGDLGNVLIYPYYTVDAIPHEQTIFSVDSRKPKAKTIRVQFVEGR